ncbi:NAD(+) diphosphatase [Methanimicrococcus blatticola]|uniref:NAD(+) diphosphatase n=1 Tax=Methanimicrococcus blatticola TaxID=91560 RepID=A0A484F4Z5_9EURY|nr:NAD(+) diphosphatase [Methanimicrococcus blatticola]MBZ3936315.1 NAD(+) diphosphatase [Methanimicrococcus blatticola]MCC2508319.1 NAD(+) diphosphatase [Methanimicrococcus blatticola]TDQ70227.1 NAD+ diphosphatase [Methanimicrococcus blatticola]
MLQDIEPNQFRNEFENKEPKDFDFVLIFKEDLVLLKNDETALEIPRFDDFEEKVKIQKNAVYLFSINNESYFLAAPSVGKDLESGERFEYKKMRGVLTDAAKTQAFACATAFHLSKWYSTRQFCGRCGEKTTHKNDERAVICPNCHLTEYPKISPVVIVGIKNGEDLLMTKYTTAASEYRNYALVAGFVEIGETLENAVRREVLEEVGVHVKNITYYKSQPWGLSESLLAGFFADLDGDSTLRLDDKELSEAVWVPRTEIPEVDSLMSLTGNMIEAFRSGKYQMNNRTIKNKSANK